MKWQQVIDAVTSYAALLRERGTAPVQHTNHVGPGDEQVMEHALWMCGQVLTFDESRREKAMRWLGFIQCAMWTSGMRAIPSMKDDNRGAE